MYHCGKKRAYDAFQGTVKKRKEMKNEKAEKVVDSNGNEFVFCLLTLENKKEKEKRFNLCWNIGRVQVCCCTW